ncbi:carbohydrate porin [Methylosinus sp. Sm6]|uniref:carbohydrate porin n=1 Tax=Methylosinus sp. Sm6 TaxID=2866948 RepID=UPI002104B1A6|nr:carbohydrate porin [Methylosinus sp. Sm6]
MRLIFLATAALASAAAVRAPRAAEPAPAFSWEGMHIGVNAGAGFPVSSGGRLDGFGADAFGLAAPAHDRAGASFGAQVGYDWRTGDIVYGVETDLNFLGLRRAATGLFASPAGPSGHALAADENGNYFMSLRGRLGYALGPWLVYGTGGVATGGWRGASTLLRLPSFALYHAPVSQSSRMKFAIGAGVERALSERWSARLEYLYLNQQLQTRLFENEAAPPFTARQRSEAHVLRFGLNCRFSPREQMSTTERGAGGAGAQARRSDNPDEARTQGGGESEPAEAKKEEATATAPENFNFHWQTTAVLQGYPKFPAPYSGFFSLPPNGRADVGTTTDLFFGMRLWEGAAAYFNPEINAGHALADSVGLAAYADGAVAKVGSSAPYLRFQRWFLRQIIGLGGSASGQDPETGGYDETLQTAQNQLAGKVPKDRLTFTIGKFAVPDIFDGNKYAHDSTTGFLNSAVNSMGAFDYGSDWWGYTYGAALEWKQDRWTARAGLFQLSQYPSWPVIEPRIGYQFTAVAELERRYELFGRPGAIRLLGYGDNGYFNRLDEVVNAALASGDLPPDAYGPRPRKRHFKLGGGVNLEQEISKDIGFFLRASIADGRYQSIDFADIDRSLAFGFTAEGGLWGREQDEIGAAMVFSGLSSPHIRYFALGGIGVSIGDGAMTYAGEKVVEGYYRYRLRDGVDLSLDYQLVGNPAHNVARGPVNIFGVRLRAMF